MSADPAAASSPETAPKRSGAEVVKESSRALRGSIAGELGAASDQFAKSDAALLKFHGTYQQEDRDARKSRRAEGLGKHFMFMVRCKIPGGRMTAAPASPLERVNQRMSRVSPGVHSSCSQAPWPVPGAGASTPGWW